MAGRALGVVLGSRLGSKLGVDLAARAGIEYAPDSETDTGHTWGGATVYAQTWEDDEAPGFQNGTTLQTGVGVIVRVWGWITNGLNDFPMLYEDGTATAQVYVDTSNNLLTNATGTYIGEPYKFVVWYTKV